MFIDVSGVKHRWLLAARSGEKRRKPRRFSCQLETTDVGTRLGPLAKLVDFECDGPEADGTLLDIFDGDVPVTPSFLSRKGPHRLFRWDVGLEALGVANMKFRDLEIRLGAGGNTAQSLLPPSRTDGHTRYWLVSLDDCDPAPIPEHVIERLLAIKISRVKAVPGIDTQRPHEISVFSMSSVYHPENALVATLPKEAGTRHRQIFEFVRHLKAIPHLADADLEQLRPWVEEWHSRALPFIATKDFEETWIDFAAGWGRVKYPAGQEPIRQIYEQALTLEPPAAALRYPQPALRNLVSLCRNLQIIAGDAPFYLAGRTAAQLIDVEHPQGARWLKLLVIDRVLELVSQGSRNRASEYRYVAEGADQHPDGSSGEILRGGRQK